MFDNDPNLATKFEADSVGGIGLIPTVVSTKFTFTPPIQGNSFRVITDIKGINSGSEKANIKVNDDAVITNDGSNPTETIQHIYDFGGTSGISTIEFSQSPPSGSIYDIEIFNIELFIMEDTKPFEFNDSVLTTHGWNSSRYDGKQLSSAKINEYTAGDTTFAHTPVVSNFTRNIYIGSRVIGMREPGLGSAEDPTLTPFPGFSYITVDDYITVNQDDSITRRSIRSGIGEAGELNAKKGFYQAWYQDFPIGTNVEVRPLDTRLAQSLAPRYNIFNNSGQLQKILLVTQNHAVYTGSDAGSIEYDSGSYYAASYNSSSRIFDFCSGSGNPNGTDIGAEFSIFNNLLLVNDFFTGSLIAAPQGVNDPVPTDDLEPAIPDFGGGGGIVDNTSDNPIASVVGINDDSSDDGGPIIGGDDDGGIGDTSGTET
jgi:hypothetical protein